MWTGEGTLHIYRPWMSEFGHYKLICFENILNITEQRSQMRARNRNQKAGITAKIHFS